MASAAGLAPASQSRADVEAYYHGYFEFDPGLTQLVLQRFPQPDGSPTDSQIVPEIWVYNTENDSLVQVASNAFLPQWVP